MILSAIVAVSENHAIGRDNQLPWHLPDDLKFFKKVTIGKPVLMGRKTYESMGQPLKGRLNIVISGKKDLALPEEVLVFDTIEAGIRRMEAEGSDEGFIIGGGQIFAETMNQLDRIYLTKVQTTIDDATTFFPDLDHSHWKVVWEEAHGVDERHAYPFVFQKLERIDL